MRNFVAGILVTLVVLPVGLWCFLRLGYADMRASAQPSWLETRLAITALQSSTARHARGQQNPIPASDTNLFDGARLYRDKCADCHGRPDNPQSDYGRSFSPPAPQFMNAPPHLPQNQEFYIVKYGVRRTAMPAWGGIMAESEMWQVVTVLDRLQNLPTSVQEELHRPAGTNP
jgi:mono/diheme cytochrome c family protein